MQSSDINTLPVRLAGICFDGNSSYLQGPALAPNRIRSVMQSGASNAFTENGFAPFESHKMSDVGNLDVPDYFSIRDRVGEVLAKEARTLILGGDHSITYPIIQAYQQYFGRFDILQIDAHADLYDDFEGNKFSHACPFARIMEADLCATLHQVGVRTLNPHQRDQIKRFKVNCIEMQHFDAGVRPILTRPVYISLDLDGLDPADAPGVSHHEPGGLTTREVLRLIQNINVPIVGADIVEYNPHRDHCDRTAAVAAKFVKEIAGKMLQS